VVKHAIDAWQCGWILENELRSLTRLLEAFDLTYQSIAPSPLPGTAVHQLREELLSLSMGLMPGGGTAVTTGGVTRTTPAYVSDTPCTRALNDARGAFSKGGTLGVGVTSIVCNRVFRALSPL